MALALKNILIYLTIYFVIMLTWQGYEWIRFNEVKPDIFHSIVCVILSISLTVNIMYMRISFK